MSRSISNCILFWHNKQMYLLGKNISKHYTVVFFTEKIIQKKVMFIPYEFTNLTSNFFFLEINISELDS